jgi:exopolysaccharide production protein ExoZ
MASKPYPFINPGWSLEYEIIFYAIVGAGLPWIRLWGVVLVLITLALTASAVRPEQGFHLVDQSYLFFAAGIIPYLLRGRSWREAAPLAVVCLSLAYARIYEAIPMALSEAMLALAIGFASLLVTVVSLERNGWKVPRFFVRIGDISYSLYLWHWILIPSVGTLRHTFFSGEGSPEFWRWVSVCLSLVVAYASFRWIDRPSISLGERLGQRIGKRWAQDRRLSEA